MIRPKYSLGEMINYKKFWVIYLQELLLPGVVKYQKIYYKTSLQEFISVTLQILGQKINLKQSNLGIFVNFHKFSKRRI